MNLRISGGNSADKPLSVVTRKYLGSKRVLASLIREKIEAASGIPGVFFDALLGTGAVAAEFIGAGIKKIIACDNLLSNTVIFRGSFALPEPERAAFEAALTELNGLPGFDGYITTHFAGSYFTRENCRRLDAVREAIERKRQSEEISEGVFGALLASFLLSADRAANTLGQYDAYLKNLGKAGFENGRHVVDVRVYETFRLRPLEFLPPIEREIFTEDIFRIAGTVEADTAYIDPPYNGRQYCDNYHLLENLARWEKPPVKGKTGKFPRAYLKSPFSRKKEAASALARLFHEVRAKHVYVSYNSEGILSREEIIALIPPHRFIDCWEIPYPVFGRGAGVARKRTIIEYLFYFTKD